MQLLQYQTFLKTAKRFDQTFLKFVASAQTASATIGTDQQLFGIGIVMPPKFNQVQSSDRAAANRRAWTLSAADNAFSHGASSTDLDSETR
jgi:DNA-binding transcriptional regulator YdaS (Cro superfamily)